ncbi:hypothetical protein MTO96_035285 [Rhipicephalus appendiculatus]
MESRRTFALKETVVVATVAYILIACLSTVTGQGVNRCEPDSVKKCYLQYKHAIWLEQFDPSRDGVYDEEELKRACSRIKEKSTCHEYLADCPDMANGDYRIQERGYEAMTNIVCNSKMLKDFHTAYQCYDKTNLEGKINIEITCLKQSFNSSCPLPMKTAQTALDRVADAITQLAGCHSSAHAFMASKGVLILLVAPVILSWFRA